MPPLRVFACWGNFVVALGNAVAVIGLSGNDDIRTNRELDVITVVVGRSVACISLIQIDKHAGKLSVIGVDIGTVNDIYAVVIVIYRTGILDSAVGRASEFLPSAE